MEKVLNFSEPFLNAEYVSQVENYPIQGKTIVFNIDTEPMEIEGFMLQPMKSCIFSNTTISKGENVILITVAENDFLGQSIKIDEEIIKNTWHHAYDFFNLPQLKKTPLWLSDKETIGKFTLNLWYAPKGTSCGIYHEQPFRELRIQIFGVGSMQLFHRNKPKTMFRQVMMSPGYTDDSYYSKTGNYPWHQYYAETDCIWLSIEEHDR